ncbi:hypothetical protein [Peptoniphilus timonensis]|uniref:hypothetical protein n=1 Tax=Peptoniphilus timonensis TaxID=1268254 RepID=UPI00030E5F1C|nr:hypothetical protein [Peptoniphilus timonensis]
MNNNSKDIEKLTTENTEFNREIGVFGGVSIIGGIMIGSGIFYLGSYVLQRTNMNSGLALICWVIGGLITLFWRTLLCRTWYCYAKGWRKNCLLK